MCYARDSGERVWTYDIKVDGSAQTFHGDMTRYGQLLLVASDPVEGHVYGFDESSGDVIWKWASGSGVSSDLMVVDERVFAVTLANELVALDVATGDEIWHSEGAPDAGDTPITPSPVLFAGDLIWGRTDGALSRRSVATGEVMWSTALGAPISMDPLLHDGSIIVGLADARMQQIDPANGDVLLEAELEGNPTYRWLPAGDNLIVGMTGITGSGRRVVALDARTLQTAWVLAPAEGFQWTSAQPGSGWDMMLVGSDEPALYAIDPSDGSVAWRADVQKAPRTIKVVGQELYIGTFGGTLLAYRR